MTKEENEVEEAEITGRLLVMEERGVAQCDAWRCPATSGEK